MSNKSTLEPVGQSSLEKPSSIADAIKNQEEEVSEDFVVSSKRDGNQPRKNALSKREMMEELSRQRFPWDE